MEDGIKQIYKDDQARLLERALALPLPDAVFAIVHYNDHNRQMGPRPHCEPIPLTVLHGEFNPDDVEEWRIRARKLRNDATAVGDASLRKDGTYDRLRAAYEAKHPGFMFKTYEDAVGFGIWQAR
ncbi:hypothetical protein OSJ57_01270 [Sphingomonas sp. HH69]